MALIGDQGVIYTDGITSYKQIDVTANSNLDVMLSELRALTTFQGFPDIINIRDTCYVLK